eukprot:3399609-Pyramimonas_sp.AAC.1
MKICCEVFRAFKGGVAKHPDQKLAYIDVLLDVLKFTTPRWASPNNEDLDAADLVGDEPEVDWVLKEPGDVARCVKFFFVPWTPQKNLATTSEDRAEPK